MPYNIMEFVNYCIMCIIKWKFKYFIFKNNKINKQMSSLSLHFLLKLFLLIILCYILIAKNIILKNSRSLQIVLIVKYIKQSPLL